MSKCKYHKGGSLKYVLDEPYTDKLKVKPKSDIFTEYCTFLVSGVILIGKGFEWDGPSGPTIDTDDFMDGALIHDVLYKLMRDGHLKRWPYRLYADNELYRQVKKDKMNVIRRCYVWLGVRLGGYCSAGGRLPCRNT